MSKKSQIAFFIAALAALLLAGPTHVASAKTVEFVALGDMPYNEKDQIDDVRTIGEKIGKGGFPFVVFYGDTINGGGRCELLESRKKLINDLLPGKVIYTPGDNDWTDCDRNENAPTYEGDALERLRDIFYSGEPPKGSDWAAKHDERFKENMRWSYGGLEFVTLHIVGTGNGRWDIGNADKNRIVEALAAVGARDKANLQWLEAAFKRANDTNARGLVVVIHSDPYDPRSKPQNFPNSAWKVACPIEDPPTSWEDPRRQAWTICNPYLGFLDHLEALAAHFKKPVLLIHGSTHPYCFDRNFGGKAAPNLVRLNGPGDGAIDAAVVTFDKDNKEKPFDAVGLMGKDKKRANGELFAGGPDSGC